MTLPLCSCYCLCTEVRLKGGTSHCTGILEMKHEGQWRRVDDSHWNLKSAAVVCRELDCGSAASTEMKGSTDRPEWTITSSCVGSESSLKACVTIRSRYAASRLQVECSGKQ